MRITEGRIRQIIREETRRVLLEYVPPPPSDDTLAAAIFKECGEDLGYRTRDEVEHAVNEWYEQNWDKPQYFLRREYLYSPTTGRAQLLPRDKTFDHMVETGTISSILGTNTSPEMKLHLILHSWAIERRENSPLAKRWPATEPSDTDPRSRGAGTGEGSWETNESLLRRVIRSGIDL